jgi:CDGSH-type Zn-finger protein
MVGSPLLITDKRWLCQCGFRLKPFSQGEAGKCASDVRTEAPAIGQPNRERLAGVPQEGR